MSQLEVDKVLPQSGTTLTLGESGDTVTIPSGATLDASSGTITLPNGSVTAAKLASTAVDNTNTNSTVITGQTAETSIDGADLVLIYDDSATALRKMTRTNFVSGLGAAAGQVIQVVSASKTNTFSVSTNTFTDVTNLSVSITPSSASNKILVLCYMNGSSNQAVGSIVTRLVRDSTAISVGDASGSRIQGSSDQTVADSNHQSNMNIMFLDSPNTTSSTTYKIQIRGDGSSNHQVSINRSQGDGDNANNTRTASSITVMEVKG